MGSPTRPTGLKRRDDRPRYETRDHSTAIQQAIEGTVADVERVQAEMAETKARIETGRTTMTDAGAAFEGLADTVESVDTAVDEVAAVTDDGERTTSPDRPPTCRSASTPSTV